MSTANAASLGTQEDICALVFTRLIEGSERPRHLITGVAGVGKSAVTRTLAWRLGCYYLAQPGGAPPSRCTSPSSRSPPREEPASGRLWDALWAWWTERAAHLYPTSRTYDIGWL